MLLPFFKKMFSSRNRREIKKLYRSVRQINALESWALSLSDEEFPHLTQEFRRELQDGTKTLDQLLPQAFALAREAARRTLGERPYDVQLLGGLVLYQGRIAEMRTGEGKTLASVAPIYLQALSFKAVHVVTVNDYLASRDAMWMGQVFHFLGLSVGVSRVGASLDEKRAAYLCDITYVTNNELGFDYLRDNMAWDKTQKVLRGLGFCVVDEIDSIFIDEARTPLIISGRLEEDLRAYAEIDKLVPQFVEMFKDPLTGEYPEEESEGDYRIDEKNKRVILGPAGQDKLDRLLQEKKMITGSLYSQENFEYSHLMTQALRAHLVFSKDKDYVVSPENTVELVDEFTGRVLHGRRYSEGLHQALEAKEGVPIEQRNRTMASITFQNFFRLYEKIAGMTGTADTEAEEFSKIYHLEITVVPTNRPLRRQDEADIMYFNQEFKYQHILEEVQEAHKRGQPVLVGVTSIEKSEILSSFFKKKGLKHALLNAKNHLHEASIIAEAGQKGSITIATNMAGRGTDIKLGGSLEHLIQRATPPDAEPAEVQAIFERVSLQWEKACLEVKDLGGLYVIGTERHEARRIDNQLRGRSGRQGDPGRSLFFVSLDDDLMRLFARDGVRRIMGRLGMAQGEALSGRFFSKTLERAQKRVEERNFEIRRYLLEYDNVMALQRNFIYQQRDEILEDEDLEKRLGTSFLALLEEHLDSFKSEELHLPQVHQLFARLRDTLGLMLLEVPEGIKSLTKKKIHQDFLEAFEKNIMPKKEAMGSFFTRFLRMEYLHALDRLWQDHLDNLSSLREAVSLRAYGQKHPLTEYKHESFTLFNDMIASIRLRLLQRVLRLQVQVPTSSPFVSQALPPGIRAPLGKISVPSERVGRNDPCPCGSGKKYKYCCGR